MIVIIQNKMKKKNTHIQTCKVCIEINKLSSEMATYVCESGETTLINDTDNVFGT